MGTDKIERKGYPMIIRKFWLGADNPTPQVYVEFSEAGEIGWCPVNLETARQLAAQLTQAVAQADAYHEGYKYQSQRGFGASYGTTDGPLGAAERGNY